MSLEKIKTSAYIGFVDLKHLLKFDIVSEAKTDKITEEYVPYKDKEYTEMYKYSDEKGVLHFTDQKPKHLEYEVLYMPKSKEPGVVKGMIDKVFKKKTSGDYSAGKSSSAKDIISQTKEVLENAAGQYKEAPNALNDAKALRDQVEEVYRERDKMMEDG